MHGSSVDEIMYAARKIRSSDRRKFAEAFFDSAIVFAGDHRFQIRISETGKVEVIEGWRLKAFGVTASQSDSVLVKRQRHRPGRTDFFSELTVAINSKPSRHEQMAVEEPALLLYVAGVFLPIVAEYVIDVNGWKASGSGRIVAITSPSILEVEARKRVESATPGVHRLQVVTPNLIRNVDRFLRCSRPAHWASY